MRALIFVLSLIVISTPSFSAEVLKVKGAALLIDTAGDEIKVGQTYYLMTNGKKKGIIKIVKLRPGQALAKLIKGKALPAWTLRKRSTVTAAKIKKPKAPKPGLSKKSKSPKKRLSRRKKRNSKPSSFRERLSFGGAIGLNQNSSDVSFPNDNPPRNDSYSGSSTSFEALLDYKVNDKFSIRSSLGIQNFEASGDSDNRNCLDSNGASGQVCVVDLSYMNLDIWARYHFYEMSRFNFWAGAGLGILFVPEFNSTTALDEEDLSTTTLLQVGGGADIKITDKVSVPVWGEYGLFPSSDTVDMSAVSFYFGLTYKL